MLGDRARSPIPQGGSDFDRPRWVSIQPAPTSLARLTARPRPSRPLTVTRRSPRSRTRRSRCASAAAVVAAGALALTGPAFGAASPSPVSPEDGATFQYDPNATITFVVEARGYTRIETSASPERLPDGRFRSGLSSDPTTPVEGDPSRRWLTRQQGAYWKAPGVYYWQAVTEDCSADPDCYAEGPIRPFELVTPPEPGTPPAATPVPDGATTLDREPPLTELRLRSSHRWEPHFWRGATKIRVHADANGVAKLVVRRGSRVLMRSTKAMAMDSPAAFIYRWRCRFGGRTRFTVTGTDSAGRTMRRSVVKRVPTCADVARRKRAVERRVESDPEPRPDPNCAVDGYRLFDRVGVSCETAKLVLRRHFAGRDVPGWNCDDDRFGDAGECIGDGQFYYRD